MDRTIRVKVDGHHLTKDNRRAGIQHEANAAVLRIEFDPGWDGFAKKITFWNADMKHPVERVLTADLLEDMMTNTRVYRCSIPGEAMEEAGELTFIIDGYVNGKRVRSITGMLEVVEAPFIEQAGEPSDPTPSQAEQLQVQIDTLLGDMQDRAVRAEAAAGVAAVSAQMSAASETNAANSEQAAARYAAEAQASAGDAGVARNGAQAAQKAAEAARDEAQQIAGGDFAPLKHTHTAADVGALAADGSIAMTGKRLRLNNGSNWITGADDATTIVTSTKLKNDGTMSVGRLFTLVNNTYTPSIRNALLLRDYVDGTKVDEYTVLHTGNKSLIKPEDIGAVAKAGDTMTGHLKVQSGNAPNPIKLYTEENGAGFVGTHEDNGVYKFVRFLPSNISGIETAHFVSNVSGEYKEYQLIHEGNKSLIRPADIGAATTATYTATVSTSWQKSTDCWYQNIAVGGILATDNPIVDILPGNDNSANRLYSDAMTKVFRIATENGSIQVMATEAINIAFPIQLKVVR